MCPRCQIHRVRGMHGRRSETARHEYIPISSIIVVPQSMGHPIIVCCSQHYETGVSMRVYDYKCK